MKKLSMIVAFGLLLALGFSPVASAAYVDVWLSGGNYDTEVGDIKPFGADGQTLSPGEEFSVDVFARLSDWTGAFVNTFALGVGFDEAFVSTTWPEIGTPPGNPRFVDYAGESINGYDWEAQATLADGVYSGPDMIWVATLTFLAPETPGTYDWYTYDCDWFGDYDIMAYDATGFDHVTTWHNGTINVVPIPGAALLLGSGLLGLIGIGRRKLSA